MILEIYTLKEVGNLLGRLFVQRLIGEEGPAGKLSSIPQLERQKM